MKRWTQLVNEVFAHDLVHQRSHVQNETQPRIASEWVRKDVTNIYERAYSHISNNDALRRFNHYDLRTDQDQSVYKK